MTMKKKEPSHTSGTKRCKTETAILLAGRKGHNQPCARRKAGRVMLSHKACFNRAVERSIAATKRKGNPIARYDAQLRQAYLEYPDGKKVYVE